MKKNILWLVALSVLILSANSSEAKDYEKAFFKSLKNCSTHNSVKMNSANFESGKIIYGGDGSGCRIRTVISPGYDMICNLTNAEVQVGLKAYFDRKYEGVRSDVYKNWAPKHIFWNELLHSQACSFAYDKTGL